MRLSIILRILGLLLFVYSLSLLPPMLVSVIYQDGQLYAFTAPFVILLAAGLALWLLNSKPLKDLQSRDGFVVTALFWGVVSLVSAVPFLLSEHDTHSMTVAQAVFEAISGFTTTGATVLTGLDDKPMSILYYRQQLQFLGGLGVIVLAIAVLPMLGIGGLQLYRAEAPGPMRDDKLTPRLAHTAKALLLIYSGMAIACTLAFWGAGMSFFDALCHSFTTVSTSGFSTHDASIGYFSGKLGDTRGLIIELITIFFMLLGSLNFTVHYLAMTRLNGRAYLDDMQGRVFLGIVLVITALCVWGLMANGVYNGFWEALRYAGFHVVSIMTTSGFTTTDYSLWPPFVAVLVFSSSFVGGCVGSTAGGFRVMRVILLYKQGMREIMRLIHPNAVIPVRIGNKKVAENVAEAVWGFAFLYLASYVCISLAMMAAGLDITSGFAAAAATLNMTGPGLGSVASNFATVPEAVLWLGSFSMLLGRLEIFTLLVLLTPAFWYK